MTQKTVLVLGKTGMAGHMIFDYLNSLGKYNVFGTSMEELDAEWGIIRIEEVLKKYNPDYVVNCIGIINKYADKDPALTKRINSVFPHMLAYLCIKNNWRLVHLSTDCYLDEDLYGKSKFLGEINDRQNLTIRTSIIGPELIDGKGLFHWFMSQQNEANGFTKAYWDGITTLQLAKFIEEHIDSKNYVGIVDYRTKNSISKHDLLKIISEVFNKPVKIIEDPREMKDKRNPNPDVWCLSDYKAQLAELRNFMQGNPKYKIYLHNQSANSLKEPFYHFSVDDVFESLIEVTDKNISLFEHPFFSFLKGLHDKYNISVDLYLFFQKNISGQLRTLRDISDSLKQTIANNPWIRFGSHALDYENPPYSQTPEEQVAILDKIYNEIYRFAGKNNLSKWVRLHIFSESYELRDFFHSHGVEALFTTDKDRITTRMPEINESLKSAGLAEYNGLKFIRSHIRSENLANEAIAGEKLKELIGNHFNQYKHMILFTHEYELLREEVRLVTQEFIRELYNKKIISL